MVGRQIHKAIYIGGKTKGCRMIPSLLEKRSKKTELDDLK